MGLDQECSRQTPNIGNGDGGLVQATLKAVDGSRLGGFFVEVVPLRDCSGQEEFLYAVSCGHQDAFDLNDRQHAVLRQSHQQCMESSSLSHSSSTSHPSLCHSIIVKNLAV